MVILLEISLIERIEIMLIDEKKADVSLRIASKILNCSDISKILDLQPTKQFKIGESYSKRYPKKLREENFWIYILEIDKKVLLEDQLEKMVALIEEKKESIIKLSDCHIDIFCGYFSNNGQGGIGLESKIMGKLAKLKIDLIFDIYVTKK